LGVLVSEKYIYLVKNLRGVLAVSQKSSINSIAKWLSRKYRYRDLGIPHCILQHYSIEEKYLNGSPFHVLEYPSSTIKEYTGRFIKVLSERIWSCLAESLLLASIYASPLHLDFDAYRDLENANLVVHVVEGPLLDDSSAKLHLRIVDYSVLDSYIDSIGEVVSCVSSGCSPSKLLEMRLGRATRDEKRYWRIRGKGDQPVVVYIDYVYYVYKTSPLLVIDASENAKILLAQLVGFNLGSIKSLASA